MAEPISIGGAMALGAVQGITEFLPISSDGHLAIGAMLMEIPDPPLTLVVLLHAGTLLATIAVFWSDLRSLLRDAVAGLRTPRTFVRTESGQTFLGIVAATIPTGIIGLALEDRVEVWNDVPWIVGACLLVSAIAVLSTKWSGGERKTLPIGACLIIGVAQGIAVMPGVTRSGSTIAVAMLFGMSAPAAFRFSFLLSLPAVGGAVALKLSDPAAWSALGFAGLLGGAVALVVGYAALLLLRSVISRGRFWAFALYLIPVAIGLIAWDLSQGLRQ